MPDINSYFSPLFCLRNYPWKSLMFYFKTDLDLFILNSNFTNPWRVGSLCFYDFGFFFFPQTNATMEESSLKHTCFFWCSGVSWKIQIAGGQLYFSSYTFLFIFLSVWTILWFSGGVRKKKKGSSYVWDFFLEKSHD